jgi:hypothetical protein
MARGGHNADGLIVARWLEVVWGCVLRAVVEGLRLWRWTGLWTEGGEIEMERGK